LTDAGDRALCAAAATCFAANNCTSSGDANHCFCGTSGSACYTTDGAANGPCVAQVFAAAKTTTAASIKGEFTSSTSPLGRAVNLLGCQGSVCGSECAVP
jgi:hypothetical protein